MDARTPAEIAYDAMRLSPAPVAAPLAKQSTLAADVPIGMVDGCQVLADYDEDGDIYQACMTWQGLEISTDGYSYFHLVKDEDSKAGCDGDIDFAQWQLLSQAVKAGVVDALIELAQSNDELHFVRQRAA